MTELALVQSPREPSEKTLDDSKLRFIRSNAAEQLSAIEILSWGIKNFSTKMALSCSFGAPEGLVLLDMMHRIDPASRVFVLDTGRLPQATHDLIDRIRDRVFDLVLDHGTEHLSKSLPLLSR